MCGIFAAAWWNREPLSHEDILAARDTMFLRGPDQAGIWCGNHAALAHRRLAIIDLSDAGRQPMCNEDESIWVSFNGEIYNYQDLAQELLDRNHIFRSRSDTEVLLHGYEEWGIELLCQKLRGMFAFAIWDGRARELLVARDRLGEKPLFFTHTDGRVIVASTLNALVRFLPKKAFVPEAITAYLHLGWVPPHLCALEGAEKLLPAHYIRFSEHGRRVGRYWQLEYRSIHGVSIDQWMDQVDATLSAAVKEQLMSDVPLGGFLSGGVDSSYVAAIASREQASFKTFSMRPDEPTYDESEFSRAVARHLGTDHHELSLTWDALKCLDDLLAQFGEPFADSSAIPCYLLAQLARKHVTVALTGDGGDEAFAGYYDRSTFRRWERWRTWVPQPIRVHALDAAAWVTRMLLPESAMARRAHTLAVVLGHDAREAACRRSMISGELRDRLWGPALRTAAREDVHFDAFARRWDEARADNDFARLLYVDFMVKLPADYLVKVDVSAMACSLETRCPFLDYRVVELAASIPIDILYRDDQPKGLLKACLARRVPPESIYRPKWGFSVPIFRWLTPNSVGSLLAKPLLVEYGLIDPQSLHFIRDGFVANQRRFAKIVYTLWVLEHWLRRMFYASHSFDTVPLEHHSPQLTNTVSASIIFPP
jgi:asparagine synthase (glutamine-hydrolysing)